ncbi:IS110 family transposase [Algoriphagus aquimarinus]|uniref:IS110 family transposase n=1 Tax=Algoriphagus aquimarinus TaxID=237018 RepID=A0A5C7AFV2_9BACT|nr:IS110 family transposase [Algoriphagus aquimarinus]TXE01722.1 IS110 family transposase [Algoriphagus aquimarinus]
MKFKSFIGIDVSKSTIDAYLKINQHHAVFGNNQEGFRELVEWVMENSGLVLAKHLLFGFESTGIYSSELALFLEKHALPFHIMSGLELKRSLGIRRGKSDKADSKDIAEYLYEKQEKIQPTVLPSQTIQDLKKLFNYRERLVKNRAAFTTRLNEYETIVSGNKIKVYQKSHNTVIACLDKQIETIEKEIDKLLHKEELLLNQYMLLNSIKGIGPQTALALIILTEGFMLFNSWRNFASYAGTAPFPNQSGTFNGRTKTSKLANKRIKTLLTLCAGTSIQYSTEMKNYYQKRISEGKSKMSTLNIIRNKLLSRAFAVVNRNSRYVDTLKYAA